MVDHDQVNASFHPISVTLKDKSGKQVTEQLLFCVQHRPLQTNEQVRLDYGPRYGLSAEGQPPPQAVVKSEDSAPHRIPPATPGFMPAPQPSNDPRWLRVQAESMAALDRNMANAHGRIAAQGGRVASNDGAGLNCLIFSLLQHATRDYNPPGPEMLHQANRLRAELQLGDGMLYPDTPETQRLVERLRGDYRNFNVQVVQPAPDGSLIPVTHYGAAQGPQDSHIFYILQGGNHFEAAFVPNPQNQQQQEPQQQPPQRAGRRRRVSPPTDTQQQKNRRLD
jgi:hypothetical protein